MNGAYIQIGYKMFVYSYQMVLLRIFFMVFCYIFQVIFTKPYPARFQTPILAEPNVTVPPNSADVSTKIPISVPARAVTLPPIFSSTF